MMTIRFDSEGLDCTARRYDGNERITYILYPISSIDRWVDDAAMTYATSVVAVTGMDWDNDLTPWPAPGVPPGCPDFKGNAPQFLERVKSVVTMAEKRLGITAPERRNLIGVSLSGLFTLWQWTCCDLFTDIASLSGSFWYEGFVRWFMTRSVTGQSNAKAYFLLGDKEATSHIKAFRSVQTDTTAVVRHLQSLGIDTRFDIVPGNHYQHASERLAMAMSALNSHFSD